MRHETAKLHRTCAVVSFACLLAGCTVAHSPPKWLETVPNGVAIGCATVHADGQNAQDELAMMRAQASFADRLGVEISSNILLIDSLEEVSHQDRVLEKSSIDRVAHAKNAATVAVEVRERWRDPITGQYCVLVGGT